MLVPNLIGAFSKSYLAGRLIQGMGALMLGGITLWWVAEQVGPAEGTVLVHVTEPDVEVTVAGQDFSIEERRYAPIECRPRAGRYLLRMRRGERILYEEWFTVHRGEELILTASCPTEPGRNRISGGRTAADRRGTLRGRSGRHPDSEDRGESRSGLR